MNNLPYWCFLITRLRRVEPETSSNPFQDKKEVKSEATAFKIQHICEEMFPIYETYSSYSSLAILFLKY